MSPHAGDRRQPSAHGLPSCATRRKRILLLLCLLPLFPAAPAAAWPQSGAAEAPLFGRTIRSIGFDADGPLQRAHYDPYLGLRPGEPLTRTGVKAAIQFLYSCGRFSQVAVDARPSGDAVDVVFRLRHNYYFNRFSAEGDVDLKGRSLWEWVPLPIGQRFTAESLERSRQSVAAFLRERGYFQAAVTASTTLRETGRQVDTVFHVKSGELATVRSVEASGVPPEQAKELLRTFGYRRGKPYDRSRLSARLDAVRKRFVKNGFLAAVAGVSESHDPVSNTVALVLDVRDYGKVKVGVEGIRIDKDQVRRLLPVLAGEGIDRGILEEGADNLRDYLEGKGYASADVRIDESVDRAGVRVFQYKVAAGRRVTVASVRFSGNTVFGEEELLAAVEMQPETFFRSTGFSAMRLEDDAGALRSLYESRGYLDAAVTPLVEPAGSGRKVAVTFRCEEGPQARVQSVTLRGNEALSGDALAQKISLAPGRPYSPSLAERDRQALLTAYNDLGYLWAQVSVRAGAAAEGHAFPVVFEIREGTQAFVDRILVLGNERTRDSVVQRRIRMKENEPLSLGRMLETQQSLYGLGVFDQVRVAQQNAESTAPYQDVVVRLQESKRFTVRYGLGYQERERLRGTVEFTHDNILGFAQRAQVRFRGSSIEQQAIFTLQQPQFRPIPVDSNFTFSFLNKEDVSFESRRFNVSYQYSHPMGSHAWGMLRFNFRNVQILNSQISESELERKDSPGKYSTFSLAFVSDTRDNYLDPTRGLFSSTDFGVTPRIVSSDGFLSFFTQNSYYRPLPGSLLLAGSVRFGAARSLESDPYLPISERYFAGGSSSLRGFDTDYAGPLDPVSAKPLGGNALIVGSAEVRVPVFSSVHFAGFYDTGNVFRRIRDIRFPDFSHTLGAGLRIRTPFGPLRADYGVNMNLPGASMRQGLKRGHFFITVGPPF